MSDVAISTKPLRFSRERLHVPVLAAITVATGVGAGLGGMSLDLLLHAVQHLAYGYSQRYLVGPESFLAGVRAASPLRRIAVLEVCGLVAGVGWWAVYRFGRPLLSIREAAAAGDSRMPPFATTAHALLQIITVGLGSPLGREIAPREIGALFGGWLARVAQLSTDERRIMLGLRRRCRPGRGLQCTARRRIVRHGSVAPEFCSAGCNSGFDNIGHRRNGGLDRSGRQLAICASAFRDQRIADRMVNHSGTGIRIGRLVLWSIGTRGTQARVAQRFDHCVVRGGLFAHRSACRPVSRIPGERQRAVPAWA